MKPNRDHTPSTALARKWESGVTMSCLMERPGGMSINIADAGTIVNPIQGAFPGLVIPQ